MRILFVPLDERPCNSKFPSLIANEHPKVEIKTVPLNYLGNKKEVPNVDALWDYLIENVKENDYLVVSMDTLLYGGLIPSRLHYLEESIIDQRLEKLKKLKESKKITILASNVIMRCPTYNSSEEEPDYYEEYGVALHRSAFINDKKERVGITEEEAKELLSYKIPTNIKNDYETRRSFNEETNIKILKLVKQGIIDKLVIPQDDATPFGYTAKSQKKVFAAIKELKLQSKVSIYPGADEVGSTLCGLALNLEENRKPKFFPFYSSTLGPSIVPLYEDRPMHETLKHHILAIGGELALSYEEADLILAINSPGLIMQRAKEQHNNQDLTYNTYRNLKEFVIKIKRFVNEGKKVILSDSAYGNGGDIELLKLLDEEDLLDKVVAYSAWNTNANTLGTALSTGVYALDNHEVNMLNNLYRIVEDSLYQSIVRQDILNNYLPKIERKDYQFNDRMIDVEEETSKLLKNEYKELNISKKYPLDKLVVSFPWKRMFEVNLELEVGEK